MLKKSLLALVLSLSAVPLAFAGGLDTAATATTSADTSAICYDCGYSNGISFNVSTVVTTEADKVILYGTYNVYEASSKKEVVQELATAFSDLRSATKAYGVLTRSSIYTYSDWQYTNLYDGSLSVRMELVKHSDLEAAEAVFYDKSFDLWTDVQVTDTGAVEKTAISTLKDLIKSQKSVYEELLEYTLGRITGLSVYTSVDASTFDPTSNSVDVTVWADVSYEAQQ